MFSIISLPHTTIRTLGVRIIMSLFCVKRQLYVNYLSNGEVLCLLTNITIALSCHIHFDPMRKYSLLLSFTVVLGSQNKLIQNKVFFLILLFNILNTLLRIYSFVLIIFKICILVLHISKLRDVYKTCFLAKLK